MKTYIVRIDSESNVLNICFLLFAQETKQKKKTKFKPYTGRLKSASVSQMTTSLDDSEMNMVAAQLKASFQGQQENISGLVNMPASCHSILKVG